MIGFNHSLTVFSRIFCIELLHSREGRATPLPRKKILDTALLQHKLFLHVSIILMADVCVQLCYRIETVSSLWYLTISATAAVGYKPGSCL